ncbi:MAG: UMP kinase [Saprospiraceae bacterium]
MALKYKRVLLKLSGEALMGDQPFGIQSDQLRHYASEIKSAVDAGVEIAIVIGGGNIYRGLNAENSGVERVQGDYMGMLATVINGMALQSTIEDHGIYTRLVSAIKMEQIAEPYIRRRAIRHLEKKRVVIFSGGTGNPYFTTDSAAALRGNEISAEVLLKGTKVNGIYSADPNKDPQAIKYPEISFKDAINQSLGVMDMTAFTICQENKLPIIIFDVTEKGNLLRILEGDMELGSLVS